MAKVRRPYVLILRVLKIIGAVVAVILVLFGSISWFVTRNKDAWLVEQIDASMNEAQSGQLEIGSVSFRPFRNFPDVSIQLDSINYYEKKDSVRNPGERPILYAEKLYVALEFIPLIRGEVRVSEINLTKAELSIVEYDNGQLNLDLAMAKPKHTSKPAASKKEVSNPSASPSTSPTTPAKPKQTTPAKATPSMQVDLEMIQLEKFHLTWRGYKNAASSSLLVEYLEASLSTQEKMVTVRLSSTSKVQVLFVNKTRIPTGDLTFDADLDYDMQHQKLIVRKSKIDYDIFTASLQGTYAHLANRALELEVDASSNDLALLSRLIKPQVIRNNPNMLKQGDVYIKGNIFGELKHQPPQFDISFGVSNLAMEMPKNLGLFKGIGFDGHFVSGRAANYSEAELDIRKIRGQLPGGFLRGQFNIKNFKEPHVRYRLDAKLKLDGYDEIFTIDLLHNLSGSISARARFDGPLRLIATQEMDSSRTSSIQLEHVSFVLSKTNKLVSGLSGKIETRNNQSSIQDLTLTYGKNDLLLHATVDNLVPYLIKRESEVSASGNLRARQLFTADFILDTLMSAQINDRISDVSIDFRLKTDTFRTGAFPAIDFDISTLSAKFDKLPDIKRFSARGRLVDEVRGLVLDLDDLKATFPQGRLEAKGDLLVPDQHQMVFNAKVKLNNFPWTYVRDVAAEIQEGREPNAKSRSVKEMDIMTGELDVSASIRPYPFDINKLIVRNSSMVWNHPDGRSFSVNNTNVSLEHLHFMHPKNSGALTGIKSVAGTMELMKLSLPGLKPFDVRMTVTGKEDKLDVGFTSATQVARSEDGRIQLDIAGPVPVYQLHYAVKDTRIETFIAKYHKGKFLEGTVDYTIDLHATGNSWVTTRKSLSGNIEVTGDSLQIYGVDIDDALTKFEKSQKFNLTDLGAVVIAGPLGLVATKGTDFVALASVSINPSKRSPVQTLYAKWKLDHSILTTEDVAFTTRLNRIALNGSIDFEHDSIPGIRVAVLDKNGCSLMDQKMYGNFSAMKTGKLNITKTLLGSVINFANALVGKDCEVIYHGKVKGPGVIR